jgi:hypothetical protein
LELFILIGGFLSAFAYKMLQDEGSIFKIFIAGPSLFLIGISFLFFSGGNITLDESKTQQKDPSVIFSEAPTSHKIAWAIAGILGIAIAFYFIKF